MDGTQRIEALLEEIRDLQKEHLAESRAQAERGVALAEESVERQRRFATLYKWVVIAGGIIIAGAVAILLWVINTSGG